MIKSRLLVIDDEYGPRESLRFLFKDSYDVVCAESMDQGLIELENNPPDCIISDIKMPGRTGIDGLKEIRALDPLVSVVMLTGFGSLETAQEAVRHGATDYLQKPFDIEELRDAVSRYVDRTKNKRQEIENSDHLENLVFYLKSQLSAKEELAQLGEKSSEFVHDLGNPLSVINGYVQILLEDILEKRDNDREISMSYLEQIKKSVSRCQEMLDLWRERARRACSSTRKINVHQLLSEAAKNATPLTEQKNAQVMMEGDETPCWIEGNDVQVFRSIQNIVTNALEALPESEGLLQLRWHVEDSYVLITVEDNGGGFPMEKLTDMQTKHFTTKGDSGGMGQGLFIAKNIIEAHGGYLLLANNSKKTGAFVTLAFPAFK